MQLKTQNWMVLFPVIGHIFTSMSYGHEIWISGSSRGVEPLKTN